MGKIILIKDKFYKFTKIMIVIIMFLCSLSISSCSARKVKENLTPEIIAQAYEESPYKTFLVSMGDNEHVVDNQALKVWKEPNESDDYIIICCFESKKYAKKFYRKAKQYVIPFAIISPIFDSDGKFIIDNYQRYDYIVVESFITTKSPNRKNMIKILKSILY
jgi:hypothetical protein